MTKYKVIRQHYGDRLYMQGETREIAEAEARHLVPRCLEPIAAKAEPAPKNKAEGPAPKNKARDYADRTVDELKALAGERKVDLGDAKRKADIIAALELADEQGADDPEAGE
jgi:hypothetical protein